MLSVQPMVCTAMPETPDLLALCIVCCVMSTCICGKWFRVQVVAFEQVRVEVPIHPFMYSSYLQADIKLRDVRAGLTYAHTMLLLPQL